jgi:hypothetical protein
VEDVVVDWVFAFIGGRLREVCMGRWLKKTDIFEFRRRRRQLAIEIRVFVIVKARRELSIS